MNFGIPDFGNSRHTQRKWEASATEIPVSAGQRQKKAYQSLLVKSCLSNTEHLFGRVLVQSDWSFGEAATGICMGLATLTGTFAAALNPIGYAYAQWGYWGEMAAVFLGMGLGVMVLALGAGVACVGLDKREKRHLATTAAHVRIAEAKAKHPRRGRRRRSSSSWSSSSCSLDSDFSI